jgi:cell division protein FtsB
MFWRRVLLTVSLGLNIILLYSLIWGQDGAFAYKELKDECLTLEKKIQGLDEVNLALSKEIRLLRTDDKYIEKMIRTKLNFVRDNEILYTFPDDDSVASGAPSNEAKN